MADERPKAENPFAGLDIAEDADAAWGDDWEAAFQSEENMFFSEETETGPSSTAGGEAGAAATAEPGPADSLVRGSQETSQDTAHTATDHARRIPFIVAATSLASAAMGFSRRILQRLQALPLFLRIPLCLLPAAAFALLIFVALQGPGTPAPPQSPTQHAKMLLPAASDRADTGTAATEKVRKKWAFPSFLIPVETENSDQPVIFVQADITLIAVLSAEEEPPAEKEIPVRDMIYQFYRNTPHAELRRFSLARGEMSRKLRDWLHNEWPEAPIESIVFDHYTLS
jgi:hypothetical protein